MKVYLFFVVALSNWPFLNFAQYKVDSMCGAKVILDKKGNLLARYNPQVPGAAYSTVAGLAVNFLKNCPADTVTGLPLYLTHSSIYRNKKEGHGYVGSGWPNNPVVINAGLVQSLAIDWRNYTGDTTVLDIARKALDLQINNGSTTAGWEWAYVPYASADAGNPVYQGASTFDTAVTEENRGRGDGSFVIEIDKIGDMGMAYLQFYEITGVAKYLEAAIHCADALAVHCRSSWNGKNINWQKLKQVSPWPFRVKAKTGDIIEDYTSHVVDNLRLLEELYRIKDRIMLSSQKASAYRITADKVWQWLYSSEGPVKTYIWKGYFEDIRIDSLNLNRVNNSPMEFARYLLKHPQKDSNLRITIPALLYWVKNTFGEKGMNAINEQTGCYDPMGSHTARYASVCALWYQYSGDEHYKREASLYFNHASYMAEPDGVVNVGHSWGSEIWFSDGYTDYIKHFMEGIAAVPEWAPAGENHLLNSTSIIQSINYLASDILYTSYDSTGNEVFRLASKPLSVRTEEKANTGIHLNSVKWTWQQLQQGGILRISRIRCNRIKIRVH